MKSDRFKSHPKQWDVALTVFNIETPSIIALNADQIAILELFYQLKSFRNEGYAEFTGIYFNRKSYFKGKWLKYGGYYLRYLLKMFRTGVGYSDLNENMNHRFTVPGKNIVYKKGHIIEENLKENQISFWIQRHNRYSDLVAVEEYQRERYLRKQTIQPKFFGTSYQPIAFYKRLWL